MELTLKQEEAVKIVKQRFLDGEKQSVIGGYAGAGKSSAVKAIIQSLPHINPETDVVYTSFTGKAVQVLQSKGNHNVSTLHKLLYEHVMMPDGSFISTKKSHINYKVVIVDEISMVPKKLLDDLMSHNVYVIALGDPA